MGGQNNDSKKENKVEEETIIRGGVVKEENVFIKVGLDLDKTEKEITKNPPKADKIKIVEKITAIGVNKKGAEVLSKKVDKMVKDKAKEIEKKTGIPTTGSGSVKSKNTNKNKNE